MVPKGFLVVCVGIELKRFIILTPCLSSPLTSSYFTPFSYINILRKHKTNQKPKTCFSTVSIPRVIISSNASSENEWKEK
ncbi:hypothetical protein VIGAN_01383500 [Vigna angularis var. angularis]|uniref:Uncharacterized protein n=1 Tax=Vigna angularis var. angularis TaxID=157739 RepID=A0A0S3R5Q0_PHAAN|nr:hypothetical protein VIGAN_01383500 [Vigna angularis var. angularis]